MHSNRRLLADWLLERDIFGLLFGPTMHVEVLKRCPDVLRLIADERLLTTQHLDIMWAAVKVLLQGSQPPNKKTCRERGGKGDVCLVCN